MDTQIKKTIMKFRFIIFFIGIFFCSNIFAQYNNDTLQILNYLKKQENAWNNGSIFEYMQYYWQSDSLMFMGKNGITYGWEQTYQNYTKSYPDKETMGKLTFKNLLFKPIDKDYIIVIGKWELIREKGNVGGYFSLLWKNIKGDWKIILDHSS